MYLSMLCQALTFELDTERKPHFIGEKDSPSRVIPLGDGRECVGMSHESVKRRPSKRKDGLAEYKENLRMLEKIHKLELQKLNTL